MLSRCLRGHHASLTEKTTVSHGHATEHLGRARQVINGSANSADRSAVRSRGRVMAHGRALPVVAALWPGQRRRLGVADGFEHLEARAHG